LIACNIIWCWPCFLTSSMEGAFMYCLLAMEDIFTLRSVMHSVVMNFSFNSLYTFDLTIDLTKGFSFLKFPITSKSFVLTTWCSSAFRILSYSTYFKYTFS
jgi:hypothetical protein